MYNWPEKNMQKERASGKPVKKSWRDGWLFKGFGYSLLSPVHEDSFLGDS